MTPTILDAQGNRLSVGDWVLDKRRERVARISGLDRWGVIAISTATGDPGGAVRHIVEESGRAVFRCNNVIRLSRGDEDA